MEVRPWRIRHSIMPGPPDTPHNLDNPNLGNLDILKVVLGSQQCHS